LLDHPTLSASELQLKADQIYRKILHDYSRFSVSTIDGFVQKVIRGFAFELGLNADYNLEMNYDKVKEDLVQKLDESLNHNPQLLQWIIDLAIERIGDNKSWNYKAELYNLINEIFKDSFSVFDDAVRALGLENVNEIFKNYSQLTKSEITSFEEELSAIAASGLKVMEQYGIENDHLKDKSKNGLLKLLFVARKDFSKIDAVFNLVDQPEKWLQKTANFPGFYEELNAVLQQLQRVYDEKQPNYELAIAFNKNLYYLRLMQEIAALLSSYRNENDNLLISDAQKLITGITDDAGENPSFIWEKVGNRYRNFLFDEFQDTSTSQWLSFKSLLSNAMASPSENLIDNLIVGDAKQSIYRWRNGDWNILHRQAKADVGEFNVLEAKLEENYRSTEHIISFNNYLYQSIPLILQQELNTNINSQKREIIEWWQDKGYDSVINGVYESSRQNHAANTKAGGTIKVKRFGKDDAPALDRFYETDFREIAIADVVEEIKSLKAKGYPANEIAILVRANSEALFCVNKLMEQDIAVISGDALMVANNSSIQLLINTLRILVGVDSQTALYKGNCIALYHQLHQRKVEPISYFDLKGKPLNSLNQLLPPTLCSNWQSWIQLPLSELIENLIDAYELKNLHQHLPYLLAFRDLISNATKLGEKGIVSFLSWWEVDGIKKSLPSPEGADAVQIITIHKSKGLAFRAVFVPFCNWELKTKANSIFWVNAEETIYKELRGIPLKFTDPLSKSAVSKAYFNEVLDSNLDSLNMLYVATTRAKDYLYLATMDKTERSKLTTIGDVLTLSLAQLTQFETSADGKENNFEETNRYEIIDDVLVENEAPSTSNIKLDEYPTTDRLSELYVLPQEKHLKHILNIEKSGRKGSLLHDVLANASNEKEVEDYLLKLMLEGDVLAEEKDDLKQAVLEVLNHPALKELFGGASENIIEKTIIDLDGKPKRPDRILIRENEVSILDYKFTVEQSQQHVEQILSYKNLLMQMGYHNIRTYLFYAVDKELKLVGA
jgi:ATP-dependent helicase/nuclease subunit A